MDEVILMSYNNGLVSCMNEKEFLTSIDWAVSNPFKSGARDIFGAYAPIVRPQEMMLTPSNISLYNRLGIKALCLYYSGVPFDCFRTLIPLMPEEDAFNPLWYRYRDEKIAIIPAISHSDLIDYGCLGSLVKRLHKKQLNGEFNKDVLVFINLDADALLWYGLELPFPLDRLPNAGGIDGMIREVMELDYVIFDTPYNYLKTHPPTKTVSFNQDTADGMFDGYSSWAEKPFNQLIWTRIEKARILSDRSFWLLNLTGQNDIQSKVKRLLDLSFYEGLCLMSTTHFGLSAPHINAAREMKALEMSDRMLGYTKKAWETLIKSRIQEFPVCMEKCYYNQTEYNIVIPILLSDIETKSPFVKVAISLKEGVAYDISRFMLYYNSRESSEGAFIDIDRHNDGSIKEFLLFIFPKEDKPSRLDIVVRDECCDKAYNTNIFVSDSRLAGNGIEVICEDTSIIEFRAFGQRFGGRDFIRSYIRYRQGVIVGDFDFKIQKKELIKPWRGGKVAGYRFKGKIDLPCQLKSGHFAMDLFIVDGIPALFVKMNIRYPYTPENDLVSNEVAVLGHYCDSHWIESVPLQITPKIHGMPDIIKYNYQGDLSNYELYDFKRADEKNIMLDSFNNHVTAGFVGIGDGNKGIVIATDRSRLGSMAFCPMRTFMQDNSLNISANPFGTYYGSQRHHRTYKGGLAQKLVVAASPYHRSLAPAFNGCKTNFLLALFPYQKSKIDDKTVNNVKSFCDGGLITTLPNEFTIDEIADNVTTNRHQGSIYENGENLTKLSSNITSGLKLKVVCNIIKSWLFN
jgi:hypothetical protein